MRIGILVAPNGRHYPVLTLQANGTILLQGPFACFETTIEKAIRDGYLLAEGNDDLRAYWEQASQKQRPGSAL